MLIENTGQYPIASNEAFKDIYAPVLSLEGLEDLPLLLSIMFGRNIDKTDIDWSKTKVCSIRDDGRISVQKELRQAQFQLLQWCQSKGAHTEEIEIPELRQSAEIWSGALESCRWTNF